MELLEFYITQLTQSFHLPLPKELCGGAGSVFIGCTSSMSFLLLYVLALLFAIIYICSKKGGRKITLIFSALLSIVSCFYFVDYSMKQVVRPSMYGIEWFAISYYFWCFVIFNSFLGGLVFNKYKRSIVKSVFVITIFFVALFAYTGRGNFEQITPIAGGLFAAFKLKFLLMSFSFMLLCGLLLISLIAGVLAALKFWIVTGNIQYFFRNYLLLFVCYIFLVLLPTLSIPLGEYFNEKDVAEAKSYIDRLKDQVQKYYYENGEYPKFIEKMLPAGRSPRLLERHEFYTDGIRGTYYFSRADKFCFLFQDPTRDFGYYSLTSERDWRFNKKSDDYDNVFINLCDESEKNYDDLISNHLGIADPTDELVNAAAAEAGIAAIGEKGNMTNKASSVLEEKIIEESKKDPGLLGEDIKKDLNEK